MEKQTAKSFEDLIVWQKAHKWVLSIYKHTDRFPQKEIFGITSQLKRAAISVPANIAEGFKKRGKADKVRFMNIAQGSLEECRYYLILARDLQYLEQKSWAELKEGLEEISKMIEAYAKAIRSSMS